MKRTQLQSDWAKEIRRIKRFIKRAEKRGFSFTDYKIPEQPKRITKQRLRELKAETTPVKLYKQSTYTTPEGETMSGYEGRQYERIKSHLSDEDDSIINNMRHILESWEAESDSSRIKPANRYAKESILQFLDNAINTIGKKQVATNIQENSEYLYSQIERALSDSRPEVIGMSLSIIASILSGSPLTMEESDELDGERGWGSLI